MSAKKGPKKYWPSYRYSAECPEGQVFQSEQDVPDGWVSHPNMIGKSGEAAPAPKAASPAKKQTKAEKAEEHRQNLLIQARAKFGHVVPDNASVEELESSLGAADGNGS